MGDRDKSHRQSVTRTVSNDSPRLGMPDTESRSGDHILNAAEFHTQRHQVSQRDEQAETGPTGARRLTGVSGSSTQGRWPTGATDRLEGELRLVESETGITPPVIPGYEILEELGRGGMGVVYRAIYKPGDLNKQVALKVLPCDRCDDQAVARFKQEASAAANLQHPNIVPVLDYGHANDTFFYSMEYVAGPTLGEVIRRFAGSGLASHSNDDVLRLAGLDLSKVRADLRSMRLEVPYYSVVSKWIAEVAEGLHVAHTHEKRIWHRDIKPANLLLAPDGRVRITDFGLVRFGDRPAESMPGSLVGTLRYMSPEQICGGRLPLDHRTDIHALGATLYELLTLRPAYDAATQSELLSLILTTPPTPPRALDSSVPAALEAICLKAMAKKPDDRFQTALEMAADLRSIGGEAAGPPVPPSSRQSRFALVATSFALMLATFLSVAWHMRTKDNGAGNASVTEPGRTLRSVDQSGELNEVAGNKVSVPPGTEPEISDAGAGSKQPAGNAENPDHETAATGRATLSNSLETSDRFGVGVVEGHSREDASRAADQDHRSRMPRVALAILEDRNCTDDHPTIHYGGIAHDRYRRALDQAGMTIRPLTNNTDRDKHELCRDAARAGADWLIYGEVFARPVQQISTEAVSGWRWELTQRLTVYQAGGREFAVLEVPESHEIVALQNNAEFAAEPLGRFAGDHAKDAAKRILRAWQEQLDP